MSAAILHFPCREPSDGTECAHPATVVNLPNQGERHLAVITDGHELFRAVGSNSRQLVWDSEMVRKCLDVVGRCGRIIVAANLPMETMGYAQQTARRAWHHGNKVRTVSLVDVWHTLDYKHDPPGCLEVLVLSKEYILSFDTPFHLGWSPHTSARATSIAVGTYTDIELDSKELLAQLYAGEFQSEVFTHVHIGPPSDLVRVL